MMLRPSLIAVVLLGVLMGSPAHADDSGAGSSPTTTRHVTLVEGGSFVTSSQAYAVPLTGSAGLFGWGSTYKLDAGVQPNLVGGYTAGLGATVGAAPGQLGSDYSLRIGGGWGGDWFSVNPYSRLGLSQVPTPGGDMALSFTYSRAIFPGLSLTGTAEAYHPVGGASPLDQQGGNNQLVIGAGLGLQF